LQGFTQFSQSLLPQGSFPTPFPIERVGAQHAQCLPTARRQLNDSGAGVGGVGHSGDVIMPFQPCHGLGYRLTTDPESVGQIRGV
jgi:hypothetical protein